MIRLVLLLLLLLLLMLLMLLLASFHTYLRGAGGFLNRGSDRPY